MSKSDRFATWMAVFAIVMFALGVFVLAPMHKRAEQECAAKGGVMLARGYECIKKEAVIK